MAGDGRREQGDIEEAEVFEEPADEWQSAISDVKPLGHRDEGFAGLADPPAVGLAERFREKRDAEQPEIADSAFALDRRTAERLRRGQIPVEVTLDLHGFTQDEAAEALDTFLTGAWAEARRCLLIVTGKGTARDGGGVLRSAVPRWLGESRHAENILGLAPAEARDGGDGAIYVLMHRQRG